MSQRAPTPTQKKRDTKTPVAQATGYDGVLDDWDGRLTASHAPRIDAITPRQVMALQRMLGNNAVQHMLQPQEKPGA